MLLFILSRLMIGERVADYDQRSAIQISKLLKSCEEGRVNGFDI